MTEKSPPPVFNEVQIRAKCVYEHTHEFCNECDDTGYINRWVKIDDMLRHITMDNTVINLEWHNPTIVE